MRGGLAPGPASQKLRTALDHLWPTFVTRWTHHETLRGPWDTSGSGVRKGAVVCV